MGLRGATTIARMTSNTKRATVLSLAAFVAITVGACGGSDETDTSTEGESALDAAAFKSCIFSGSIDLGIYEEIRDAAPELANAAPEAEFFEAGKGDDGIAAFYVFDDPAAAEAFSTEFEPTLAALAKELTRGAGIGPVTPAVEIQDGVVLGLIPFDTAKEAELSEEVLADVSTCVTEQSGTG